MVAPVPVLAVLALVPVVAVLWGWSGLPWSSVAVAVRPTSALLSPLSLSGPAVFGISAWMTGSTGALLECGRNAVGLLGLVVVGLRLGGDRGAVVLPVGYLTAAFLVGRPRASPTSYGWAWILRDGGDLAALLTATVLGVLGVVLVPGVAGAAVRGR